MKVRFKGGIAGFNGTAEGMIFYTLRRMQMSVGRVKPQKVTLSQQHDDYKVIMRNLKAICPSDGYKTNFRMYFGLFALLPDYDPKVSSWYNLYIQMMFAMNKAGAIPLLSITREIIYAQDLPCKTVKAAVEAGFLPVVADYQLLDAEI